MRSRVAAFDDLQEDLDALTAALQCHVEQYNCDMEQRTQEEVLRDALARLDEVAPDILILDLRWSVPSSFFEGERFLRLAITRGLLRDVHLVFWTRYLGEAAVRIEKMTPLLAAAGVKSIARFYKSELGELVDQLRTLGCSPNPR